MANQSTNLEFQLPDPSGTNRALRTAEGLNDADGALSGILELDMGVLSSPYTIPYSSAEGGVKTGLQFMLMRLTGSPGGAFTIVVPANKHLFVITNETSQTGTVKVSGQTGVSVPAGDTLLVIVNGTDVEDITLTTASGSLASTTEVLTGTNITKAVTPDALAALWEKGSDVASAGTISLGEGGFFHVTGTTTITDIDFATAKDGRIAFVVFDGILTLTHNATTLKLPGNANITTAAGDRAIFVQDSSDNVICISYVRADGSPLNSHILRDNVSSNLTSGFTSTAFSAGTKSSGTFTPDPSNGNLQYYTNGGAHTLDPPSAGSGDSLTMVIKITNNGSAGAITTSGFDKVSGDSFTTTNGDIFMCYAAVIGSTSHLNVVAMQ